MELVHSDAFWSGLAVCLVLTIAVLALFMCHSVVMDKKPLPPRGPSALERGYYDAGHQAGMRLALSRLRRARTWKQ